MLKFLTHKLRTHSLNEDQPHQDKADDDHDSGTESDDEQGETEDQESIMESEAERSSGSTVSPVPYAARGITACSPASPYFLDSALPSDSDHNYDHHSSEEELEVINNPSNCAAVGSSVKELLTCRSGSVSTVMPEKRKWSQMTGGSTCSLSDACHLTAHSSGRLTVAETSFVHGGSSSNVALGGGGGGGGRASVAVIATTPAADQNSGSSDEEVQGLLAAMATPVQFRTSPPLDAHKPGRSQSPPPKLFHYGGHASAATAVEVSPRKRHRHTPRAHHIQRPCLDFEKMQQMKARAVTAWRHSGDHGGELSVYCW